LIIDYWLFPIIQNHCMSRTLLAIAHLKNSQSSIVNRQF